MKALTDIHTHTLPGIDDGAQTFLDTKRLMKQSVQKGVKRFVFTPHFYPESMNIDDFLKNREQAVKSVGKLAKKMKIRFRVGAEIQFTPVLDTLPLKDLSISGTPYVLLELLPQYEPYDAVGLIQRIRSLGYIPILAHVERFHYIKENPVFLYELIQAGALAQINAGWILKNPGSKKRLQQYFRWNLIHVMASDMHSVDRRPQNLADAYAAIPLEIAMTFQTNAEMIFNGDIVKPEIPIKPKRMFGHWR